MTKLSNIIINNYADLLMSQGEEVLDVEGVLWMNYYGALIPAQAMPVYVDLKDDAAALMVKKSTALFLRYATGPMTTPTNWWNIVCRYYDFKSVSSNTRSKIRRGTRRLEIEQVSSDWLRRQGYECHVKSYQR